MSRKKYKIIKATLRYANGTSDVIQSSIETDNIEAERQRMIDEYRCKTVHLRFNENFGKLERVGK